MRYCVIKNTIIIIDGSKNPVEIMLKNATNAGFSETEVEILTEEEYQIRLEAVPLIPTPPTIEDRVTNTEIDVVALEETIAVIFGGV